MMVEELYLRQKELEDFERDQEQANLEDERKAYEECCFIERKLAEACKKLKKDEKEIIKNLIEDFNKSYEGEITYKANSVEITYRR